MIYYVCADESASHLEASGGRGRRQTVPENFHSSAKMSQECISPLKLHAGEGKTGTII